MHTVLFYVQHENQVPVLVPVEGVAERHRRARRACCAAGSRRRAYRRTHSLKDGRAPSGTEVSVRTRRLLFRTTATPVRPVRAVGTQLPAWPTWHAP